MAPLEDRRAEVDVVDVQRVAVDVDVRPLQAPLLARLPRQIVLGVVHDRKAAEDGVAELMAAQTARAGAITQPMPSAAPISSMWLLPRGPAPITSCSATTSASMSRSTAAMRSGRVRRSMPTTGGCCR